MKIEQTECSEMSAIKHRTPEKNSNISYIIHFASTCLWRWNTHSVPKRRLLNTIRRRTTQMVRIVFKSKIYYNTALVKSHALSALKPCWQVDGYGRFAKFILTISSSVFGHDLIWQKNWLFRIKKQTISFCMSVRLYVYSSVCSHGKTLLPLDRIQQN
jgi:hypothetical protein